jgi:mannose-6-phosphate isomerase
MPKLEESIQSATLTLTNGNSKEKDIAETGQRPWGSYTVLEEGRGYKIKRIEVKPGHRLSLQLHHHRSEHWIVVSGTAKVTCAEQEILLSTNQSTYVPPCTQHRLENVGVIPLVLIEVQNGEYLGEDDIVRFHDDYARVGDKAK